MVRRAISAQRHQQKYTRRPHPRLRHPPHTRRQPFRPTQVESHFIPEGGDPTHGFGIEKFVGAVTSPGWFDAVQETVVVSSQLDLKAGRSEDRGVLFWRNADGTLKTKTVGKVAFTMDEKTNAPKGTSEGKLEIVE